MSATLDVAVVGVSSLVGETLLALLAEDRLPIGRLYLLDDKAGAGGRIEFQGGYLRVEDVAGFDFGQVQLAFFCTTEAIAAAQVPRATAAGCVVIDDSACFRMNADVPLVVPEVNPGAIAGYRQRNIIANPNTCVTLLGVVLKPIQVLAGLAHIDVVTCQAVSGAGRGGVEELAAQSTALFNMKPIKKKVFSKQIAFNLLPQIGALADDGYAEEERKIIRETRKILEDESLAVNATCIRVPVFHGHAMAVQLEMRSAVKLEDVHACLSVAAGVKLIDGDRQGAYPTPVTEAVGKDSVFVGRMRLDISRPRGLNLWIVADNVRKGAALNCVQTADILIREHIFAERG